MVQHQGRPSTNESRGIRQYRTAVVVGKFSLLFHLNNLPCSALPAWYTIWKMAELYRRKLLLLQSSHLLKIHMLYENSRKKSLILSKRRQTAIPFAESNAMAGGGRGDRKFNTVKLKNQSYYFISSIHHFSFPDMAPLSVYLVLLEFSV
jgi:hypothetical protein